MKNIDPFACARAGRIFEEELSLDNMERLAAVLLDTQGTVIVSLYFDTDREGQAYCSGKIKATLTLICQRCMAALEYKVECSVKLGLVKTESELAQLAKQYEPVLVTNNEISIDQLVEDELVLALPAYAKHDKDPCTAQASYNTGASDNISTKEKKVNPFAVLASLKK